MTFGPVAMKMPEPNGKGGTLWGLLALYAPKVKGGASLQDTSSLGRIVVPAPGMGNEAWGIGIAHHTSIKPGLADEGTLGPSHIVLGGRAYWPCVVACTNKHFDGSVSIAAMVNGAPPEVLYILPTNMTNTELIVRLRTATVHALKEMSIPSWMVDNREVLEYE